MNLQRIMHLAKFPSIISGLALFWITTFCGPASAWNSASNLGGYCATLAEELDKGVNPMSDRSTVCITYFQGVGDALISEGGAGMTSCMAKHYLNLDDLNTPRIFLEYLRRNPSRGNDMASDVIRDSIKEVCHQ